MVAELDVVEDDLGDVLRMVGRRLVLVCQACERRPETCARLQEVISVDWAQH